MCGILGGTISEQDANRSIRHMNRGNDGNNLVSLESRRDIVFAFRRHSVIAPNDKRSMQPIVSEDGKVALVMNGEIFEYKKYKEHLIKKGVVVKSEGDAEVLLLLYIYDADLFYKAVSESMCSVGLFDNRDTTPKIKILRDWIGEMPLHYVHDKDRNVFVFASEIKSLLHAADGKLDMIRSLEPGNMIDVELDEFNLTSDSYFEWDNSNAEYTDLPSIGKKLRSLLEQSAQTRMIADVPVCCLLSGGIDSTVTTYLVKKHLDEKGADLTLYCFHVKGHPVDEASDLYHARKVAAHLGMEDRLREVHISEKEIVESIPQVIYGLEDTRLKDFNVYTAIYNHFLAQRIASDGFKVVFNGEGSDEFHGSYGSWGSFVVDPEEIITIGFRKKMAKNLFKGVLQRTSKVMMHSGPVEMRSFFLSPEVGNYILNIPPQFLRDGSVWKMPLVEAFRDVIPEEILKRPKERPQDATGIMRLKEAVIKRYKEYGDTDSEIFSNLFAEIFVSK